MSRTALPSFNRSVACAAFAIGCLGTVSAAHAALVTRNIDQVISAAALDSFDLDVDLDGNSDFTFEAAFSADPFFGNVAFAQIRLPFASSNSFVVDSGAGSSFALVSRLLAGATVASTSMFSGLGDLGELASEFVAPPTGNFLGLSGFVGLRFDAAGSTRYGFAQISVDGSNTADPYTIRITQVGYDDAGLAVQVPDGTVPEPGSLALLGAAGMGFLATRRRRVVAS